MALTYLKIFADMEETLSLYSDEERGRLLSAMMAYSFRGEEPEFTGAERFVWPMIRKNIDSCEEKNEKLKANGKRGGRPETKDNQSESKDNQTKPNETKVEETESKKKPIQEQEQDQDHEQEHVHEQDHKSARGKRARFVPPTMDEVQTFMLENGGTHVQAVRFHTYYASNGWKVGKNPMKDWKSAARGWILRDKDGGFSGGRTASSQPRDAMQRHNYTSADFKAMITDLDKEDYNRPKGKDGDRLMRYTPEERRKTYRAAEVNIFDEED